MGLKLPRNGLVQHHVPAAGHKPLGLQAQTEKQNQKIVFLKGKIKLNINYKQASLQDEEELFILAASLAASFKLNKADFSKIYADLLSDANADIVIAETESRLIGYVLAFHHSTFYANGVISWVEELFVLDEFRGMKIGKKLMEIIEGKALERGSKLVALATRRASGFYKAIGYDESAVYFKKALT